MSERTGAPPLWDHQGQVLRGWHQQFVSARDVALELPTGAGKTLVAGVIGEFQRRTAGDRVAYLCLTKQLAAQTADRLGEYGIPTVLLTGRVKTWDQSARARYRSGEAVAVSTYSHVFNGNPALDDVTTLLLDDAHGAADYVAGPWSLTIDRGPVYHDVLSLISDSLDSLVVQGLRRDGADADYRAGVYLASPHGVAQVKDDLETLLHQAAMSGGLSEEASWARKMLEGNVDRCLIYISHRSLLIRPLIPPTGTHPAFDDPARRIYLSATLGHGGELERAFGRRKIKRIPVPKGWDKRGTGRRLFCFPQLTTDLSRKPDDVPAWVKERIKEAGRAVAIGPDFRTIATLVTECVPDGFEVLTATDVEDSLDPFIDSDAALLTLSNRYDGIDLPDEDCRLVVLDGLPAKGDLQERFLYSALGAQNVLQERIRARIAQGAGRATRNFRDYSTVIVLGDDLVSYLTRNDVQSAFHPDLHAEIEFGWQQSLDGDSANMTENIAIFDEHGNDWANVEEDILAKRDQYERIDPAGATQLQDAARAEVEAWEAIWSGDWTAALEAARKVIDCLVGGRSSGRYAGLWNYLAASISLRLHRATGDAQYTTTATAYLRDARGCARGTKWLDYLVSAADTLDDPTMQAELDPLDQLAVNNILTRLVTLGRPIAFDTAVTQMRKAVSEKPATPYEQALVDLGHYAGASESLARSKSAAAPDGAWLFGDITWISWEAKSEAKDDGELGAGYTREAGGHLRYLSRSRDQDLPGDSFGFIVTPQTRTHPAAALVAEDHLWLLRPDQVLNLHDKIIRAWRRVRSLNNPDMRAVAGIFSQERALPTQWISDLRTTQLAELRSTVSVVAE
ncbi:DEAD/DEAH box helicase [Pseudarthrobacter sp. NPDC055928]|uniref:DEAD/DEAH box helicase n=1 Tax=Pseudarthrobacter sp. NPDC055928 TaxID=3345661 RepID=UPI0035D8B9D2